MNQNAVVQLVAVAIVLFGALFGMMFILDAPGNNLSRAFYFCIACGFLIALLNPRSGMLLLVLCAGYLDLVKRFLILYGNVNMLDLMTILGTAPIIFAGICLSVLIHRFLSGNNLNMREWLLVFMASFAVCVIIAGEIHSRGGGMLSGVAYGANSAAYVPMMLFAGLLYPTLEDQKQILKVLCLVFVPVAVYGIWQHFAGWNQLEIQYMTSGLTMTANYLKEAVVRPYSTMNSNHGFGLFMGILCAYCVIRFKVEKEHRLMWGLMGVLFAAANFFSLVRTTWALLLAAVVGMILFRNKLLTIVAYALFVTGFLAIVLYGMQIIEFIQWTLRVAALDNDFLRRALTVGTMEPRVESIQSWTTSTEPWSWWGKEVTFSDSSRHDPAADILYRYGGVVLVSVVALGAAFLHYCHKQVLAIEAGERRDMAVYYLSVVFALVATSAFTGSQLAIFPVNMIFWFYIGFLCKFFLLPDKPKPAPVSVTIQARIPGNMRINPSLQGR